MADFCKECHDEMWGEDVPCDTKGLCKKGEMVSILCEGCGEYVWIDHTGRRVK